MQINRIERVVFFYPNSEIDNFWSEVSDRIFSHMAKIFIKATPVSGLIASYEILKLPIINNFYQLTIGEQSKFYDDLALGKGKIFIGLGFSFLKAEWIELEFAYKILQQNQSAMENEDFAPSFLVDCGSLANPMFNFKFGLKQDLSTALNLQDLARNLCYKFSFAKFEQKEIFKQVGVKFTETKLSVIDHSERGIQ